MSELEKHFKVLEDYAQAEDVMPIFSQRAQTFLERANSGVKIISTPALLSVQKLKSVDDLWKRAQKYGSCYLQPKYDGVSVQAVYWYTGLTHRLLFCGTRLGKDCTRQMEQLIPLENEDFSNLADSDGFVVLRGEVVLKDKTTFPGFVSPRTAATSYINTHIPRNSERYTVKWFDQYEVHYTGTVVMRDLMDDEIPLGECNSKQDIVDFLRDVQNLPEFCDGIVLKALNIKGYGATAHHPHWSAALKYVSPTATSIVRNIYTTTGETGRVTPVVEFDPVMISGTTIAKASGGSEDTLRRKGIKVGSRVLIELAGQTIPHIKEVI